VLRNVIPAKAGIQEISDFASIGFLDTGFRRCDGWLFSSLLTPNQPRATFSSGPENDQRAARCRKYLGGVSGRRVSSQSGDTEGPT